jgi:hypothetical protein
MFISFLKKKSYLFIYFSTVAFSSDFSTKYGTRTHISFFCISRCIFYPLQFVDGRKPAVFCPLKRLTFSSSILKAKKLQLTLFYWVTLEHKFQRKNEATVALEKVVFNCAVTVKNNEATVAREKVMSISPVIL